MNAYLTWADRSGLKVLYPETDTAIRSINSRLREGGELFAIWSVLDAPTASLIESLLDAAEYQSALQCLLLRAICCGQYL